MALGPRSRGAPKHQACPRCLACHRRQAPRHRCRSSLRRRRRRPLHKRLPLRRPCLRSISSLRPDLCRHPECPRLPWLRLRSAPAFRPRRPLRARACPSLLPGRPVFRRAVRPRCRRLLPAELRAVSRRLRLRSAALRPCRLRSRACLALLRPCRRPLRCRSPVRCRLRPHRRDIRSSICRPGLRPVLTCRILRCLVSPGLRPWLLRPPLLRPLPRPQQAASPVASS